MADRRKLAQGLMMMTPAMRKDLAGREQDIQRGKTVELLRRAGKEMYDNPIVNTAIGFTPGVGDVQAAGETMAALQRGAPWQETAGYAVGMLPFVPALRTTWHGSPHGFTKFDMSKIGTGEGAQAYGHGLYLAEAKPVAEEYATNLSKDVFNVGGELFNPADIKHLNVRTLARKGDLDSAINKAAELAASDSPVADLARLDLDLLQQAKAKGGFQEAPGYLYKVELPDEQIAKMLDWDKPLSEQAPEVIDAMKSMTNDVISGGFDLSRANRDLTRAFNPVTRDEVIKEIMAEYPHLSLQNGKLYERSGSEIPEMAITDWMRNKHGIGYEDAGQWIRDMSHVIGSQADVSSTLFNNGIPGIKYLDQASRGAGEGTRNYVVFSDEIPQILERNGQPIAQALREYKQQFPEGMLGKTGMFETGTPVSFEYIRNTEKSPYMGEKFGQDIEPAGRYLSYKDPVVNMESMPNTWETGQVSFNNPLVVNFGEGYGTPTNWKKMVSESFGGKTGKDLSKAVANAGYDGIVTVDKYGTSEIVDLSNFLSKEK